MGTDPTGFNSTLINSNKANNNFIKPLVRLLKAWNANYGYVYASYELEKRVVEDMSFWFPLSLKDYFYQAVEQLPEPWGMPAYKKEKPYLSALRTACQVAPVRKMVPPCQN